MSDKHVSAFVSYNQVKQNEAGGKKKKKQNVSLELVALNNFAIKGSFLIGGCLVGVKVSTTILVAVVCFFQDSRVWALAHAHTFISTYLV